MSISTLNDLVAASRQKLVIFKKTQATKGAGFYASLWKTEGLPGPGNTPPTGIGEAPTANTPGALPLVEIGGGALMYAGRFVGQITIAGTLIIYDRLVHTSGLVGNITTLQVVNTAPLTRYTDGVGVECFLETYTATGSSSVDITVNYTDHAGESKSVTMAHQNSPSIEQMQPVLPIFGCRSVQSVQFAASTGSAGDFGITLAKRICELPLLANEGAVLGPFSVGLPRIMSGACLAMMVVASSTSTGVLSGASLDVLQR